VNMGESLPVTPSQTGRGWPGKWVFHWEERIPGNLALGILKSISQACPSQKNSRSGVSRFLQLKITLQKAAGTDPYTLEVIDKTVILHLHPGILTGKWDQIRKALSEEITLIDINACGIPVEQISGSDRSRRLNVAILVIQHPGDSRWRNSGMPIAPLILAGEAVKAGHNAEIVPCTLGSSPPLFKQCPDVIAASLYEDMFLETRDLLHDLKRSCTAWIVTGGPMAILAPDAVAAHLHPADFVLRGDGEISFQKLLKILSHEDRETEFSCCFTQDLLTIQGLYYHGERCIVSSDFDLNPENPSPGNFDLTFSGTGIDTLKNGLEYSTSRGCAGRCYFCSHVHGRTVRSIPMDTIQVHLSAFLTHIRGLTSSQTLPSSALTVNLNDDDLLMNPERCIRIIQMIRSQGMKIWGIQTSLDALIHTSRQEHLMTFLSDPELYPGGRPLMWIGTDAFNSARLARLGKVGGSADIEFIAQVLKKNKILGCHYWIMTDADSDWEEFLEELMMLHALTESCGETFRILPNAASLIPYPSTPMYRLRFHQKRHNRIEMKTVLQTDRLTDFNYPLVAFERPDSPFLHALVEPEARVPERLMFNARNFIRDIRKKDLLSAIFRSLQAMRMEADAVRGTAPDRAEHLDALRIRYQERMSSPPQFKEF
jgi:hypothetical protein